MKSITILGAGESGFGAAMLAHHKGFNVFVSDLNKITQDTSTREKLIINGMERIRPAVYTLSKWFAVVLANLKKLNRCYLLNKSIPKCR